jgi:hypothetical protein
VDSVKSFVNVSPRGEIELRVTFKETVPQKNVEAEAERVAKALQKRMTFKLAFVERTPVFDEDNDVTFPDPVFTTPGIAEYIAAWTNWRIDLEKRAQQLHLVELQKKLHYAKLMEYATRPDIVKIIVKVTQTKTDDPYALLAKKLKLSVEDATVILHHRIVDLSRMNRDKIVETIKKLNIEITATKGHIKKPGKKVLVDMKAARIDLRRMEQQEAE